MGRPEVPRGVCQLFAEPTEAATNCLVSTSLSHCDGGKGVCGELLGAGDHG